MLPMQQDNGKEGVRRRVGGCEAGIRGCKAGTKGCVAGFKRFLAGIGSIRQGLRDARQGLEAVRWGLRAARQRQWTSVDQDASYQSFQKRSLFFSSRWVVRSLSIGLGLQYSIA